MAEQKNILLVEDEPFIAMFEQNILENYGYRVVISYSGEKAIEIVDTTPNINLILMDINLGDGMLGTQAAEVILSRHDLPLIFLSSHTGRSIVEKTEGITSYGYIVKDSGETVLIASIKMAFRLFEAKMKEKEKEKIARKSEYSLKMAQRMAKIGSWILDISNSELTWSDEVYRIFEIEPTSFIATYQTFLDVIHPDDRAMVEQAYTSSLQNRTSYSIDHRLSMKDGRIKYVHEYCETEFSEDGKPLLSRGTIQDITEQKCSEYILREREAQLSSLSDNLSNGYVYQIDSGKKGSLRKFTYISAGVEKLHGVSVEEVLSNPLSLYHLILEEDQKKVVELEQSAFLAMETFKAEVRFQSGNHSIRWMLFTSTPRNLYDGRIVWDGFAIDITDLKMAEELIVESELKYRRLIEGLGDRYAVFSHTIDGVFLYASPSFQTLFDVDSNEVIGKNWRTLNLTPKSLKDGELADLTIVQNGCLQTVELVCRHRDGKEKIIEVVYGPVYYQGKVIALEGICNDITKRKREEESLKASERYYRDLFESSRDGFVTVDIEGCFISANPSYCSMLGYATLEELKQEKNFYEITPQCWHEFERMEIIEKRLFQQGYSGIYEKEYIRKDGTVFPIEIQAYTYFDSQKRPKYLWAIVRDITDRKKIEHELYRHKFAIESSITAIAFSDLKGNLLYINQSFIEMWGYQNQDEILGKNAIEFWMSEQGPKQVIVALFSKGNYAGEMEAKRKDASTFIAYLSANIVRDSSGNPIYLMSSFIDISERKQAEEKIRKLLAEKEIILKEVHHRIKNNICSIEGLLSVKSKATANPEVRRALQETIGGVKSIRLIYEKLLLSDDYHDISIKSYLDNLIDTMIPLLVANHHIEIVRDITDFNMSPRLLYPIGIIVNELFTNAMKYAFHGRENGKVKIGLMKEDNLVTLQIEDDGNGLPKGWDIDSSKSFGLVLVKMLTQQVNGKFTIESNCGTKCSLTFQNLMYRGNAL